jgi:hypothetical protein
MCINMKIGMDKETKKIKTWTLIWIQTPAWTVTVTGTWIRTRRERGMVPGTGTGTGAETGSGTRTETGYIYDTCTFAVQPYM